MGCLNGHFVSWGACSNVCNSIFFNVGSHKEDIFFDHLLWSLFQSSLHILQITIFSHVGPLWAASMYCIYTCLFIFIEKFSTLPGFEHGTSRPRYQANMLPTELSCLGSRVKVFIQNFTVS